jgi:hypothetical protein
LNKRQDLTIQSERGSVVDPSGICRRRAFCVVDATIQLRGRDIAVAIGLTSRLAHVDLDQ